jgi:hypothetical protein
MHSNTTTDQLAKSFNVSRRSIFNARELVATGRNDLCEAVERGEIRLTEALRIAKPKKYGAGGRDCLKEIQRAWKAATPEERGIIILWLADELDRIKTARDFP